MQESHIAKLLNNSETMTPQQKRQIEHGLGRPFDALSFYPASFTIKNISKIGSFKIELGIPLILMLGGLLVAVLLVMLEEVTFHGWIEAGKASFSDGFFCYFFMPLIAFFAYGVLPSIVLYTLFGKHAFCVLHQGELTHQIYMFNVKIIERKYTHISNVDIKESKTHSYRVGLGMRTEIEPEEIYLAVNHPRRKSVRLIQSFKAGMLHPLYAFLQKSLGLRPSPAEV